MMLLFVTLACWAQLPPAGAWRPDRRPFPVGGGVTAAPGADTFSNGDEIGESQGVPRGFVATIQYFDEHTATWYHVCSGTLVAGDRVVTLASCALHWGSRDYRVGLGWRTLGSMGAEGTQVYRVVAWKNHPRAAVMDWWVPKHGGDEQLLMTLNDVAVITLEAHALATPTVWPIQNIKPDKEYSKSGYCTVFGFGMDNDNHADENHDYPHKKHNHTYDNHNQQYETDESPEEGDNYPVIDTVAMTEGQLFQVPREPCENPYEEVFSKKFRFTKHRTCTISHKSAMFEHRLQGRDCRGDYGGPIVCDGQLWGLVQYTASCNMPMVNILVASYRHWINRNLGRQRGLVWRRH